MGMDRMSRDLIAPGHQVEHPVDAPGSKGKAVRIGKEKAAGNPGRVQPLDCLLLQILWKINSADLSAFGTEVQAAHAKMLRLNLHQFADTYSCAGQDAYQKIAGPVLIPFQPFFQTVVILVGYDGIQKGVLKILNGSQTIAAALGLVLR